MSFVFYPRVGGIGCGPVVVAAMEKVAEAHGRKWPVLRIASKQNKIPIVNPKQAAPIHSAIRSLILSPLILLHRPIAALAPCT